MLPFLSPDPHLIASFLLWAAQLLLSFGGWFAEASESRPREVAEAPKTGSVAALSPEERQRLAAFEAEQLRLSAAGEIDAQRRSSLAYVDAAPPNTVRDTVMHNLAKKALRRSDTAEAEKFYAKLQEEGVSTYHRRRGTQGLFKLLFQDGRTAEAEELVRAMPQHGVGGVDSLAKVADAEVRSGFFLSLGKLEEARQSFLSQQPPADAERRVRDAYIESARRLAATMTIIGDAPQALGFQMSLLQRFPRVASPEFLGDVYQSARASGDGVAEEAVLDLARARHPDHPRTYGLLEFAARHADDPARAARYRAAAEAHPYAATAAAARARRAAGLGTDGDAQKPPTLSPVPDPAFDFPAEKRPAGTPDH